MVKLTPVKEAEEEIGWAPECEKRSRRHTRSQPSQKRICPEANEGGSLEHAASTGAF